MAVLLVLLLGAFSLAKSITTRQREQAVLALKKPEALERYEQLALQTKPQPIPEKQPESVKEGAPSPDIDEWASKDKLAHWDHLLTRWERFTADKSDDGWSTVRAALAFARSEEDGPKRLNTPEELSPEERARIEACLARNQDLVREILEVAELGGPVRVLDFSQGTDLEQPHVRSLRDMGWFLVWDVVVKARDADLQAATKSLLGAMKLSNALLGEPVFWSQLSRWAMCNRVEWALREAFKAGQLPPDELRRILAGLEKAKGRAAFSDCLRGEAYMRLRECAAFRNGEKKHYAIGSLDGAQLGGSFPSELLLRVYTGPLGAPWFNADEAAMLATMDRIATAAERPYYQIQDELASIDKELHEPSFTHVFSRMLLPGYMGLLKMQALSEASRDLTRIGLLVEEYAAQHGTYPQTLDEIAPDLGGAVPIDPLSGKPFRYLADNESFLLYGVGMNLVDDAGTPNRRDGDLVWRSNQ